MTGTEGTGSKLSICRTARALPSKSLRLVGLAISVRRAAERISLLGSLRWAVLFVRPEHPLPQLLLGHELPAYEGLVPFLLREEVLVIFAFQPLGNRA
jgi:hypothetical protein